jgi:hypothetical protein
MTATGHHEGDARSLVTTLLHSLRTHYRGQVLTVSLNQGLIYLPEVPVATKTLQQNKTTPNAPRLIEVASPQKNSTAPSF